MKKTQLRKIIGGLLSAALLCSLAACGQPSTQQASPSGTSQEPQTASPSQSSQAPQSSAATSGSESGTSQVSQAPQSVADTSKAEEAQPEATASEGKGNVMVVYFSATGNTKAVAQVIAAATEGELYEIIPETPYTSDDLNWTEPTSRSNKEHEDPSIRPTIAGGTKDLSGYDTVFIGYPIWWGEAPNIVWNFVESNNLEGKTVIPFATSSSSGFGSSGKTLEGFAPGGNWLEGRRFQSGAPETEVQSWVSGLNIQ